ncbi:PLP-dependent aminotransferase family protein [Enterovibrio baiacu]|uniref:MocR-like pyridoxine biosynthesis transcription factor PdxR n=1 Tax=Enterovibrio baiacu TaxID=2491023 RepID=UPI003D0CDEB1
MQPIDIGDLRLDAGNTSKQSALYLAIQDKILNGQWPTNGRLPATRLLAEELRVSRNTVTAVYEQLKAEGYIESRRGAGYFIQWATPDHYLHTNTQGDLQRSVPPPSLSHSPLDGEETHQRPPFDAHVRNRPFAPGVPDLAQFPYKKWARSLQCHFQRAHLGGQNDIQGNLALRQALSDYLSFSRSVDASPQRIIITVGAQQALYIAINAILDAGEKVMMENPGYAQMRKVLDRSKIDVSYLPVDAKTGADISLLDQFDGKAVYLTPSNQYPMGTSLNTNDRMRCIEWAAQKTDGKQARWIIEDDYDSEFQFANRPYPSLQGLATKFHGDAANVIYVGTFSKTLLPAIRVGYMVVPASLVEKCLSVKDAIGGDSAMHIEEVLAEFIAEGDYLRHIRKMRTLYQEKQRVFVQALHEHFGDRMEVISQAAGLHVTFRWQGGFTARDAKALLEEKGVTIRTLAFYCDAETVDEVPDWMHRTLVAGFGNSSLENIRQGVKKLAECFEAEC